MPQHNLTYVISLLDRQSLWGLPPTYTPRTDSGIRIDDYRGCCLLARTVVDLMSQSRSYFYNK